MPAASTELHHLECVSLARCAELLGISERHARNLAAEQPPRIPTIQLGGRAVVPIVWIEQQIETAIAAVTSGVAA